jgi:hypothetical protein
MQLHCEEALKFLVERLAKDQNAFCDNNSNHDVSLERAVIGFLRESSDNPRIQGNPYEVFREEQFRPVWIAFFDAAWELCRTGIFRLGESNPNAIHSSNAVSRGLFSLTVAGREWLKNATVRYVPTDPGRYVEALQRPATVLGGAFLQRAAEAAGCHRYTNHLACCAMCGAAAESALLAIAIERTGDQAKVMKEYERAGGREKIMRLIFGQSQSGSSPLEQRFRNGFGLLNYWRDEAAHGRESTIEELEAYDAMGRLLHLAFLAWDHWQDLTGKPRPA